MDIHELKFTKYFEFIRQRPDRARIRLEWILRAITEPARKMIQSDGRVRVWTWIEEEQKYLRVILLKDEVTIHNAFFDRRFKENQS